jgi:4-amino-4-deoxy-L-arabinose transferase-like glycosyltransferase
VLVTLTITTAIWSFLGIIDDEKSPNYWVVTGAISIGLGILLKGFIAIVFPLGTAGLYLFLTKQAFQKETWKKLNLPLFISIILIIALPWHILATLRNPPYFEFSMVSEPGKYRGFFWFYIFNEHILRFLGKRFPHDYNTVPIVSFWLLNLLWLFPGSAFLPTLKTLKFSLKPENRLEKLSLLALCWIAVVMGFFSFSTRQEYYSMPIYPALALLIGIALSKKEELPKFGRWLITTVFGISAIAILAILYLVRNSVAKGDISNALAKSSDVYNVYTLSLGHLGDLNLNSFAYLRFPLVLALISTFVGLLSMYWAKRNRNIAFVLLTVTMLIFFQAATQALIVFEPYLGSRPLAEALKASPPGKLVVDNQYYVFSTVFFYTNPKQALLLNGRVTNLSYGSYAPGAPNVFINDEEFKDLWLKTERFYLLVEAPAFGRLQKLLGEDKFHLVKESGGKLLLTNQP